jgi:hypothetical protein
MDSQALLLIAILAVVVALLIGAVLGRKTVQAKPSQFEQQLEADLFKAAQLTLAKLADTTTEEQSIRSAQQRIDLKKQLLKQVVAMVQSPTPPAA